MGKFITPIPNIQSSFSKSLVELKKSMLQDALLETVKNSQISEIDDQLHLYVKNEDLQTLAHKKIRGEMVFPIPCILTQSPKLLGYYRLLLGFAQKSFYSGNRGMGFGVFRNMEVKGTLSKQQTALLNDLCESLCESASLLLKEISSSSISPLFFHELSLLTLGAQLRGGRNNDLGSEAIIEVFGLIGDIVADSIVSRTDKVLTLKNAADREILIKLHSDPDIVITEKINKTVRNIIAIEVKGGQDTANAHNRLGEAEKSHQKAKKQNFNEFWTLTAFKFDEAKGKTETPTTTGFFYIPDLFKKESPAYLKFKENVILLTSIKG